MGNVNGNARFSSISVCLGGNKTYDLRVIGVDYPCQGIEYSAAEFVDVGFAWVGRCAGADYTLPGEVTLWPHERKRYRYSYRPLRCPAIPCITRSKGYGRSVGLHASAGLYEGDASTTRPERFLAALRSSNARYSEFNHHRFHAPCIGWQFRERVQRVGIGFQSMLQGAGDRLTQRSQCGQRCPQSQSSFPLVHHSVKFFNKFTFYRFPQKLALRLRLCELHLEQFDS
jgi:hypothetical protein